ncbi:hypothetical protein K504DRAFT_66186 [Pleomassaria siparia CBS 279.74]|uniref:Uncharacterized protein n=1 Tax=Pleomassaria siparia CBS 279.74 TaxID=1314801 RepID=A0A6G1K1M0_9PLEO|nr:hypothetical protein K504DRAFT_66186 [Pleomassaria siparia CBS 279.74]
MLPSVCYSGSGTRSGGCSLDDYRVNLRFRSTLHSSKPEFSPCPAELLSLPLVVLRFTATIFIALIPPCCFSVVHVISAWSRRAQDIREMFEFILCL